MSLKKLSRIKLFFHCSTQHTYIHAYVKETLLLMLMMQ